MRLDPKTTGILRKAGLDIVGLDRYIPDDFCFESPCGIKFTNIDQQCSLKAFSYSVSGFMCGVSVGRYCSFGENVQIGRQSHPLDWLSTSPFTYMESRKVVNAAIGPEGYDGAMNHSLAPTRLSRTIINNDVWVGQGAMIMPGVIIGTGAIVAAGSIVTKDVKPYSIVGGNPARHIRFRIQEDLIDKVLDSKWWDFPPSVLCNFDLSDVQKFIDSFSLKSNQFEKYLGQIQTVEKVFHE